MVIRKLFPYVAAAMLLSAPALALAQEESGANECQAGGQGLFCLNSDECAGNTMATACVENQCQIPCQDGQAAPAPRECGLGETCIAGDADYGPIYFCRPSAFAMDLNLLDNCILQFIDGLRPSVTSSNLCSLDASLNRMLDQDGNGAFNIFDVDLCIKSYLSAQPCNTTAQVCPNDQVFCGEDQDCGKGLYCNLDLHECQRECGIVANREENSLATLDRKCSSPLTVCNYDRGRCESIDVSSTTCQVNADCPTGATCFLGHCEAHCSHSTDCPDGNWYCDASNQCVPRPSPAATSGFVFDPQAYSVQFGIKSVTLSSVDNEANLPILVMNIATKKQEFANPSLVFGYRLEATYSLKQDSACTNPGNAPLPPDCAITAEKEFLTLGNPFGTIYGTGEPAIGIVLRQEGVARLTPGFYRATVTAFFSNGGQDSATISFQKTSPSGEYSGRISIYIDGPENLLGNANIGMRLYVNTNAPLMTWDGLLTAQGLPHENDIVDITQGYPIVGNLHASDSMVFDLPTALTKGQNEIPVRGLYSPQLGRMRLIAAIDIPSDFCRSDNGACTSAPDELQVRNPFARSIRRILHFVGPFDEKLHRFHGMYREVISGLTPSAETFDGGFQLDQWAADASAPTSTSPIYSAPPAAVEFPPLDRQLADLHASVVANCGPLGMAATEATFKDKIQYHNYLVGGAANRIFGSLVRLEQSIIDATVSMQPAARDLTINDFLRGKIEFCGPGSTGNCINERELRCGLALYREALLQATTTPQGEVVNQVLNLGDVDVEAGNAADLPLFCSEASTAPGCHLQWSLHPTIVSLQEHNRFFKELTQTLRYSAGNDLSDAFFVMYKSADDAIEQSLAVDYKKVKLKNSVYYYDALRAELFSPASTRLLFMWPMHRFEGRGSAWLRQLYTAFSDRLEAMNEIVDLKRRILVSADDQDYTFVQHLMHMEYLSQAYMMLLQREWEKTGFQYAGQGPEALATGQAILGRVDGTRNPLGIHPSEIFFENGNLTLSNWKNYRNQILNGPPGSGMLADVRQAVNNAIVNLKGSLQDSATFETQILNARHQFEQEMDSLCGAEETESTAEARCEIERASGAAPTYQCDDVACSSVLATFASATGDSLRGTACDYELEQITISSGAYSRKCQRGQMGSLLRQREQYRLNRKQIVAKVDNLVQRIQAQVAYIEETQTANSELIDYLEANNDAMLGMQSRLMDAEAVYQQIGHAAAALDCLIIVGMAGGSSCLGTVAQAAIMATADAVLYEVERPLKLAMQEAEALQQIELTEASQDAQLRAERMQLDNMTTEVQNLIAEYQNVTGLLFNTDAQIQDVRFQAERAARRYQETSADIVEHLIGSQSGSILLRNQYVQEANSKFDDLLVATYKLSMAFIHSYNLKSQSDEITSRVFQLMTPDDVESFLADLDRYEASYCGGAGIDCDSINNIQHFRFSVRDELFPNLKDIVDARTGKVFTKGEQFNNIITSSAFLHKRQRAGRLVKEIEIPFSIWLNDRGTNGAFVEQWMVSPLECNHIIAPSGNGTLAVNVVGTRMRNLTYEIWRGNTDYIRSCDPVQTTSYNGVISTEYPINTFVVGYAPQNSLAQQDNPPTYLSKSTGLLACKNVPESGGNFITNENCFKYFARERSLAAPDWKVVIPFEVGYGNDWILGDGNPIIEDIVIYIRYRTRPI